MTLKLNSTENRCVSTSTIGYMCLALTIWMVSMTNAGWYVRVYPHFAAMIMPMAVVLGVMGILSHLRARSLDAVVFFGGGILFWSAHAAAVAAAGPSTMEPLSYAGWFFAIWAVFFGYVWVGSFHTTLPRQLFVLGLALSLLATALTDWTGMPFLRYIGGYIGLISALLAGFVSASGFIAFGGEAHSPNDEHLGQTHPAG